MPGDLCTVPKSKKKKKKRKKKKKEGNRVEAGFRVPENCDALCCMFM
jgi:hypothetical protein